MPLHWWFPPCSLLSFLLSFLALFTPLSLLITFIPSHIVQVKKFFFCFAWENVAGRLIHHLSNHYLVTSYYFVTPGEEKKAKLDFWVWTSKVHLFTLSLGHLSITSSGYGSDKLSPLSGVFHLEEAMAYSVCVQSKPCQEGEFTWKHRYICRIYEWSPCPSSQENNGLVPASVSVIWIWISALSYIECLASGWLCYLSRF